MEGLRAVARLEQERAALRDVGEVLGEPPRLAGEDERGEGAQARLGALQLVEVRPGGLLGGRGRSRHDPGVHRSARARAHRVMVRVRVARGPARSVGSRRWRDGCGGCSAARSTPRTSATWPPPVRRSRASGSTSSSSPSPRSPSARPPRRSPTPRRASRWRSRPSPTSPARAVRDLEVADGGPTYTIDTVEAAASPRRRRARGPRRSVPTPRPRSRVAPRRRARRPRGGRRGPAPGCGEPVPRRLLGQPGADGRRSTSRAPRCVPPWPPGPTPQNSCHRAWSPSS